MQPNFGKDLFLVFTEPTHLFVQDRPKFDWKTERSLTQGNLVKKDVIAVSKSFVLIAFTSSLGVLSN